MNISPRTALLSASLSYNLIHTSDRLEVKCVYKRTSFQDVLYYFHMINYFAENHDVGDIAILLLYYFYFRIERFWGSGHFPEAHHLFSIGVGQSRIRRALILGKLVS